MCTECTQNVSYAVRGTRPKVGGFLVMCTECTQNVSYAVRGTRSYSKKNPMTVWSRLSWDLFYAVFVKLHHLFDI